MIHFIHLNVGCFVEDNRSSCIVLPQIGENLPFVEVLKVLPRVLLLHLLPPLDVVE